MHGYFSYYSKETNTYLPPANVLLVVLLNFNAVSSQAKLSHVGYAHLVYIV